ncbi:MAG TPA: fatty acid desaturase CarF family protein [Polyangiales bacterium]|nr:fatty acid desaturase CarF family protein [Polyangiales bacterium]
MESAATPAEYDTRKDSYSDMNDWLNTLVRKRIAQAERAGETMPEEMAWVAETNHAVYQRRFKPFVLIVLAVCVYGMVQAPSLAALLVTFVGMYFYIDFYSGVLHVVLDNPRFIRLPLIGVPCVEFQWHHTFAYDISTRRLLDVWGDLNVLLLLKSIFLFGICGFSPTTIMVAAVGYSWGYLNQLSHRLTHTAPRRRPRVVAWLQQHRVLLPPEIHQIHHANYDQAFPVLNGHSRGLIQGMLRIVPNGYPWLGLFLLLSAFDLVAVVWLVERVSSF